MRNRASVAGLALAAAVTTSCSGDPSSQRPASTGTSNSGSPATPTASASPTSTRSASAPTTNPAAWRPFRRSVVRTALGDPALLDVCTLAKRADLARLSFNYAAPGSAPAGQCAFSVVGPGKLFASVRVTVERVPRAVETGGGRVVRVAGQPVRAYAYSDTTRSCQRALELRQRAAVTVVRVDTIDAGAGKSTTCLLSDAIVAPFATAAARRMPAVVSSTPPTLSYVDVCRVVQAARLSTLPLLRGTKASPIGYDAGCLLTGSKGITTLANGRLLGAPDDRLGAPVSYDNHIYLGRDASNGFCMLTSKQPGNELFLGTYYSNTGTVTDDNCAQLGQAMGRYLDALGLR